MGNFARVETTKLSVGKALEQLRGADAPRPKMTRLNEETDALRRRYSAREPRGTDLKETNGPARPSAYNGHNDRACLHGLYGARQSAGQHSTPDSPGARDDNSDARPLCRDDRRDPRAWHHGNFRRPIVLAVAWELVTAWMRGNQGLPSAA
jgi:hypothetical protein